MEQITAEDLDRAHVAANEWLRKHVGDLEPEDVPQQEALDEIERLFVELGMDDSEAIKVWLMKALVPIGEALYRQNLAFGRDKTPSFRSVLGNAYLTGIFTAVWIMRERAGELPDD